MIKVGFIGPGGMGAAHIRALKALEKDYDVVITDIADVRKERVEWSKNFWPNANEWGDGDSLLNNADVDAVWIAVPTYLHAHFIIKALNKGCHVFCEKPLCLKEKDIDAILDVQKRSGKKCMVGMVVRFMWHYAFLKEINDSQKYGKLKTIVMNRVSQNPFWGWENWFNDPEKSGSVVMDLHIHDVDFLKYAFGDVELEHVTASKYEDGMVNQVISTFKIGDAHAVAEGVWHHCQKFPFVPFYRAEFEKAVFYYDAKNGYKIYWSNWEDEDGYILPPEKVFDKTGVDTGMNISDIEAYFTEDRYFLDCIKNDETVIIGSVESAAESAHLCLKIYDIAKKTAK